MADADQVGQGRQYEDATDAYDAENGTYQETVTNTPTETRLPTQNMPMFNEPNPFRLTGG